MKQIEGISTFSYNLWKPREILTDTDPILMNCVPKLNACNLSLPTEVLKNTKKSAQNEKNVELDRR